MIPTECSFDKVNNFQALLKTFEFFPSDKVTALSEANTTPFLFNIPISAVKISPKLSKPAHALMVQQLRSYQDLPTLLILYQVVGLSFLFPF